MCFATKNSGVATFLNGDYSRAVPIVSSFFTVKDYQRGTRKEGALGQEDYVEFLIADPSIQHTFPAFLKELAKLGMVAFAKRSKYVSRLMPSLSSVRLSVQDGIVLTVTRLPEHRKTRKWRLPIPVILFIATVAVVFVDGIYRSDSAFAQTYIRDPVLLAVIYTVSLMGILGIHELGHMIAAKKYGIKASWPYFIPGIPGFFVPTFGAMIQIRSNMTNRNVLFDIGMAGPVAGLIITMIVSFYGSTISVVIPFERAQELFGNMQLIEINTSLLMLATLELTGNASQDGVLVMSPVLFAAWIGFLITFLNLLPAWQLDGGHLARSALGVRWHRILTYVSIAILFALQFYIMALFVLLFSMRAPESTPLDDVSPLSQSRKAVFAVALGLAVVCAPLPSYLL